MGSELLAAALLLVIAALVYALITARRIGVRQAALASTIENAIAAAADRDAKLKVLEEALQTQQLTEQAVATGTALVREVHKGIADIPFGVLEAIPATRAPAKALRGLHDSISDGVYGAIAGLNKAVGRELRKGVSPAAPVEVLSSEPLIDSPPAVESAAETPPALPTAVPQSEPPNSKGWG